MSHASPNRLSHETSPYLLQHARNPVDWYPWGPEALALAKSKDRPIFLSIGYSACHWCHVMERECFENDSIAAMMNEHFINIKVDREERPDLDQIYMTAVQAMTQHGGWPMSVFLTPDLQPFYGGTYFPPSDSRGMPGFPRVLLSVHRAWVERRGEIIESAQEMTERLRVMGQAPSGNGGLDEPLLQGAARSLLRAFDPKEGGFGSAPKFPHAMDLRVLMRFAAHTGDTKALHAVKLTLDKMSRGGIYDHLGGGFARYSTDARWLAPHFEKMLYDNALLATTYLEAFQLTKDPEYARVVRATFYYILSRMTDPDGAFYATEDADSEGVEGKYYVWTLDEVTKILGEERAKAFAQVYDVTVSGNWEGHNILNLPRPIADAARLLGRDVDGLLADLQDDKAKLLSVREGRIPPAKDTKILTSWNGLMIAALAEGSRVLRDESYLRAAEKAAGFLLDQMRAENGLLLHGFKDGRARFNAYLDDYANLIDGLTRLYEVSGTLRWLNASIELAAVMIDEFGDVNGGFYYTGKSHEELIARTKDVYDNATPSGNAVAATALLRLAALTERDDLRIKGMATLQVLQPVMEKIPSAAGQGLIAMTREILPGRSEIVILAGADPVEYLQAIETVYSSFLPGKMVVVGTPEQALEAKEVVPLLADRAAVQGRTTTYVCEGQTCLPPVVGLQGLTDVLNFAGKSRG